jgi:hypothetical protein
VAKRKGRFNFLRASERGAHDGDAGHHDHATEYTGFPRHAPIVKSCRRRRQAATGGGAHRVVADVTEPEGFAGRKGGREAGGRRRREGAPQAIRLAHKVGEADRRSRAGEGYRGEVVLATDVIPSTGDQVMRSLAILLTMCSLLACAGSGNGTTATGGAPGSGGTTGSGGALGSGGTTGSGGTLGSGGTSGGGGTPGTGGATGTGGMTGTGCDTPNLVWKTAAKTEYTSFPDPGSPECIQYSGCDYMGMFAACDKTATEAWVAAHNIVAAFPDFATLKLHDLCLKSGSKTIVVTVIDTCGDSDCGGCCTQNKGTADELIDVESYTAARFGVPDGRIQWADLGPTTGQACP